MRSHEVVVAAHELDVPTELVLTSGVARRAAAQVRRALPNGEVEALDKRRVQGLGILRPQQRVLQPTRGPDLHAPVDSNDTVVSTRLEHLTVDAGGTNEPQDRRDVMLEAIGRDQRDSNKASPENDIRALPGDRSTATGPTQFQLRSCCPTNLAGSAPGLGTNFWMRPAKTSAM